MAIDKLVDSAQLDADLTSVADAIRTRSGESGSLSFPDGFVAAVNNIEGITDVQVDGTSIVNNGVANIPVASYNGFGVTKVKSGYGIYIDSNNAIRAQMADASQIKAGVHEYRSVVPCHQHEAVFYGLAKAAGDSTQSASANTVGNYTDTAKTAIHKMLDSANRVHKIANGVKYIYFEDGADNLPLSNVKILLPSNLPGVEVGDPSPTNVILPMPYTEVYIDHYGKNLFDPDSESSVWVDTNNAIASVNGVKAVVLYAMANDCYTLSIKEKVSGSVMEIVYVDVNFNILKRTASSTSNARTLTSIAPADTFMVIASIASFENVSEVQFEKNRVETPYEAFKSTYYSVSWEDEIGTIYGGELNITTGTLTVTKAKVALGSLDYYTTNSSPLHFVCDDTMTNHITFGDRDFICSQYKTVQETYWSSMPDYSIMGHETNNSLFRICDSRYSDVTSFKAALTEQGAELVYTLENPLVYQLTPVEIKSFLGKNFIMSEPGYVYTAEYQADTSLAVPDIQINGKSIVENYVANIPVASSTLGLVKIDNSNGIGITSGKLFVVKSGDAAVEAGTANYQPIVPSTQHAATFYGLAKAAGADMASLASTTVGQYPDAQKIAIQKMLGIYEPPYDLIDEITLDSEKRFEITTDSNGTPLNLRNVFIYVFYPADSTSASTGYARYEFHDSNGTFVNAETGKYTTSTANQFKHLFVERKSNLTFANFSSRTSTGSSSTWCVKNYNNGIKHNMGNIVKIRLNASDVEPAGTVIKIWGQWAY